MLNSMRTTITLADDVAAAVERVRSDRSMGLSEAVNDLVRAGLAASEQPPRPFEQRTHPLGLTVDVTNIADVIETLEGPAAR